MRRKLDWVDALLCRARRTVHGWVESWSMGQKSQCASSACSGGVSAVMGSSDFDAHTFAQYGSFAIGVKAHCPLKQNLRQWKRRAWRWSRALLINCRDRPHQLRSQPPRQASTQYANHWTKSHGILHLGRCDPTPKRRSLCRGLA